jgi:hypothetical protein
MSANSRPRAGVASTTIMMKVKTRATKKSQQKVRAKKIKPGKPHEKTNLEGEIKMYDNLSIYPCLTNTPQHFQRTRGTTTCKEQPTARILVPRFLRKLRYPQRLPASGVSQEEPRLSPLQLAEGEAFRNFGDFNPWHDMVGKRVVRQYHPTTVREPSPFVSSYHFISRFSVPTLSRLLISCKTKRSQRSTSSTTSFVVSDIVPQSPKSISRGLFQQPCTARWRRRR